MSATLAVLLVPHLAVAQTGDFELGRRLFGRGRFADATPHLERAYAREPLPATAALLAEAAVRLRPPDQDAALAWYYRAAEGTPDRAAKARLLQRAAEVAGRIRAGASHRLVLVSVRAPHRADLDIDGRGLGSLPWRGLLAPGQHRLRVRPAEGGHDQEHDLLVEERDLTVTLQPDRGRPAGPAATPTKRRTSEEPQAGRRAAPREPDAARRRKKPVPPRRRDGLVATDVASEPREGGTAAVRPPPMPPPAPPEGPPLAITPPAVAEAPAGYSGTWRALRWGAGGLSGALLATGSLLGWLQADAYDQASHFELGRSGDIDDLRRLKEKGRSEALWGNVTLTASAVLGALLLGSLFFDGEQEDEPASRAPP